MIPTGVPVGQVLPDEDQHHDDCHDPEGPVGPIAQERSDCATAPDGEPCRAGEPRSGDQRDADNDERAGDLAEHRGRDRYDSHCSGTDGIGFDERVGHLRHDRRAREEHGRRSEHDRDPNVH